MFIIRRIRRSDISIVRRSEDKGLEVPMLNIFPRVRTDLNENLRSYFNSRLPRYTGIYDGDDILARLNSYLAEKEIVIKPLEFPLGVGSEVRLIPIGKSIKLKVVLISEYFGNGESSRYITANSFLMTESTKEKHVEAVISFIDKYLPENTRT